MQRTQVAVFDISDSVCVAAREVFRQRNISYAVYQLKREGGLGQVMLIQRELAKLCPRLVITEWVGIGAAVIQIARAVCASQPRFWLYTTLEVTAIELTNAFCIADRVFHKPHSLSDIADKAAEFLADDSRTTAGEEART